jgi:hypothetical protein
MSYGASASQTPIYPTSPESLQYKTKLGAKMEIPGVFYNQFVPTAATLSSGTVTNNGMSLVAAHQLGLTTAGTKPWGGDAAVTFSSSSGLLVSFTTSSFMPTTLNYDQFPVTFTVSAAGVLPTGITAGTVYYWQWVSATTGRLALTPNGTVIAYTDAGTATIYCQAASAAIPGTGYNGSPWLPAGALAASDNMPGGILNGNGASFRIEVMGHKIGTGTNVYTVTPGLVTTAGTWTALDAGSAGPAVSAGPFPFFITTDIMVQQYGTTSAPIAIIKTVTKMQTFSTIATNLHMTNVFAKTVSLDTTTAYGFDIRYIAATPAVAEYMEPLMVRMTAFN